MSGPIKPPKPLTIFPIKSGGLGVPLSGGTHIHILPSGGSRLTQNIEGGAKWDWDISSTGKLTERGLRIPKK